LAAAMEKLSNASGAAQGINNVAAGMQNAGRAANTTNASLTQTAQLLNQMSVSRPFQNFSIGELKTQIAEINKMLNSQGKSYLDKNGNKQTVPNLTEQEQQNLVNRRNLLQQELKIQQASDSAKIASIKRVADAQNADILLSEKRIAQARREYAERAKLYQTQNTKKNTTYEGALAFSSTANTLQRQIVAIENLKKARLSLSTADVDYKTKLDAINTAIARHNTALQQAGVQSANLAQRHRNLMDITGQLARKFALLFSVSQVQGYIGQIAKVRGEFELQQRSLEAILQNKTEADAIFQKTVDLAIKSPFQIKELVSYTKQLAAYRIEGDKLYDTTKRLADVSAGLGVDMQRLILAYGQVKAAAYLRGTEVRQFTEAGVNMYGELQSYFQEVKGEAYTTAQIVDMISKRMVKFEDVEAVFQRLTDKGGLFYNMQEIQSETLNGKIANLKDSLDVMLNDIGKSNEGTIKSTIDAVKAILDNWERVADVMYAALGLFAGIKTYTIATSLASKNWVLNLKAAVAMIGQAQGGMAKLKTFATLFSSTLKGLAAGFAGMGIMLLVDGIMKLSEKLNESDNALKDLAKSFSEVRTSVEAINDAFNNPQPKNGASVFDEQKIQLNKLQQEAKSMNIHLTTKLDEVTPENIREVFNKAKAEIDRHIESVNFMERIAARSGEGLKKSTSTIVKQYTDASDEILSAGGDISTAINLLYASTSGLTQKQKAQLLELSKGAKKGQSQLDYYMEAVKKLDAMTYYKSGFMVNGSEVDVYDDYVRKLKLSVAEIEDLTKILAPRFDEILSGVSSAYPNLIEDMKNGNKEFSDNAKEKFKDIIKDFAEKQQWRGASQEAFEAFTTEWASRMGVQGLSFKIDTNDIDTQLDSLSKFIQDYFNSQKYYIDVDIDYGNMGDKNIGKDLKNQSKTYAEAAKNAREIADQLARAKAFRGKTINNNQLGMSQSLWNDLFGSMTLEVDTSVVIEKLKEYAQTNQQLAGDLGYQDKTASKKRASDAAKNERDIWNERISVLKEMQQQYEKVRKNYGEDTARSMVKSEYSDDLAYVNMGQVINPEEIVPTKQGLIDALEKTIKALPTTLKDYRKKVSSLNKDISELKLQINTEEANRKLEETKKYVDNLFTGLDLHQKLKDIGLSESEVQALFPGLAKTLDDVERGINDRYKSEYPDGSYLDTQTKQGKDYQSEIKKLNEQRIKEQENLVIELTKAYKTQLSDQLQLDKWYYEERSKIYAKTYDKQAGTWKDTLTPEMQKEYENNLNKKYEKQKSENTWKSFQQSDYYIDMFENLEAMSTVAIKGMLSRLEDLRSSLKNLPADQVRAIINQMEKLRDTLSQRNPFSVFTESIKKYREAVKGLKVVGADGELTSQSTTFEELEKSNANNAALEASKNAQAEAANKELQYLKDQYETGVKYGTLTEEELADLKAKIADQQALTDELITQAVLQGKITAKEAEQLRNVRNLKGQWQASGENILNGVGQTLSQLSTELPNIASNFEKIFGSMSDSGKDTLDTISGVLGGLGTAASGGAQIWAGVASENPFQAISGGISAFSGLTSAIGSLFGNKDKKLQRKIEQYEKQIKRLQKAYEDYHDAMNDAFTVNSLNTNYKSAQKNLDEQIKARQNQIAAEQDKKDSNQDQIEEWRDEIEELEKQKEELHAELLQSLGGFGDDASYKDAAQEFVDAWTDAFKEGESGLDALNETWDDFIINIFKKTAMLKVADKIIDPFLQQIDGALEEYNTTGNITKLGEKIKAITAAAKDDFPEIADLLETIYGYFGINDSSTELSALQQGISSLSETTAEALEALLNSIRFFLATQQGDVAVIRQILEAQYGTSSMQATQTQSASQSSQSVSDNNPMLTELKLQTVYLQKMSGNFEDVIRAGHTKGGKGIKVFMD